MPGADYVEMVGNDDDIATALTGVRESIVLLQNDYSSLSLSENASVFMTGPSAHNIGYQSGGWSLQSWGVSGNDMFTHDVSVKQGTGKIVDNDSFTSTA
ncbi:hypothetical protein ON010_g5343 [Phytophthora cinnamomi]|nr:hypothetical protein ON010_g5343 [Phytophthora cinnamomi]